MRFAVCDALTNGSIIAGPLTNSATVITNGLFCVMLDFGSGVFTGADRWLDLAVRTNGGATFVPLTPRQQVTPAPYAIAAASVVGAVPANQLTGTIRVAQLPIVTLTNNSGGLR